MPFVTLTTEFGTKDHYVPALRGYLYREIPQVVVADITHAIRQSDISHAAYVIGHAYREFPEGTVHIIAVGASGPRKYSHVLCKMNGHFFIGCDNGIFSLLDETRPELVIEICKGGEEPGTFVARELYARFASSLLNGAPPESLGVQLPGIQEKIRPVHPPETDVLKGNVIYIDHFGNLITSISRFDFDRIGKGRAFSIDMFGDDITEIHRTYSDVPEGEKVALFNHYGMLEIAINHGPASSLLNLKLNSVIRIHFH
ncbi:MAG: SAM-dependent chlorinase/fluorinase [Bacteroidia bacterium]